MRRIGKLIGKERGRRARRKAVGTRVQGSRCEVAERISGILLGQQLLQLGVLILKLLQSLGLGDIHDPELGLPVVQRRFRDAVPAGQVRRRRASLMLLQHANDLLSSVILARFICPSSSGPDPNQRR